MLTDGEAGGDQKLGNQSNTGKQTCKKAGKNQSPVEMGKVQKEIQKSPRRNKG